MLVFDAKTFIIGNADIIYIHVNYSCLNTATAQGLRAGDCIEWTNAVRHIHAYMKEGGIDGFSFVGMEEQFTSVHISR